MIDDILAFWLPVIVGGLVALATTEMILIPILHRIVRFLSRWM